MKEIKLNTARKTKNSRLKFVAIVDDEDFELVNKHLWYAHVQQDGQWYARTRVKESGKVIYLHRFIMNAPARQIIDHRNRNGLDCRRSNMRFADATQNSCNLSHRVGCTSKYRGVHWDKHRKRWHAQVAYKKKNYHLGRFKDEIEAAKAYDKKALELHGEFSNINFKTENK